MPFAATALKNIRQRLLDLTRRNRLLNFRDTAKTIVVRDEFPDIIFQKLIDGRALSFSSTDDSEDVAAIAAPEAPDTEGDAELPVDGEDSRDSIGRHHDNDLQTIHSEELLQRRLLALFRDHRTIIEETGGNDLYLVIGLLELPELDSEETLCRAPLIMVPVHLERTGTSGRGGRIRYLLRYSDESIEKNHSLAEKLRLDYGIELPDFPEDIEPEPYLAQVESAIASTRTERWQVMRRMSLGLLSFAKLAMWRDLDPQNWPSQRSLLSHPLVLRLLGSTQEPEPPGQLKEDYTVDHEDPAKAAPEYPLITEADVSQYSAIVDAVSRRSGLVIEGPPGTGKSQTITNLIATFLSQGKSVLFMAEKMAALRVVYDRLERAGLERHCLKLHGYNTKKKEVLEELEHRLNHHSTPVKDVHKKRDDLKRTKRELLGHSTRVQTLLGPHLLPLHDAVWHVEKLRKRLPDSADVLASQLVVNLRDSPDLDRFLSNQEALERLGTEWRDIPAAARQAYEGLMPHEYRDSMRDVAKATFASFLSATGKSAQFLSELGATTVVPGCDSARLLYPVGKAAAADIPDIPAEAPLDFVKRIFTRAKLDELPPLLGRIDNFITTVGELDAVFDYRAAGMPEKVKRAKSVASALLVKWCLPDTQIAELQQERDHYEAVLAHLQALQADAAPVVPFVRTPLRTVQDFRDCATRASDLAHGPEALFLHASPHLLREAAKALLGQAIKTSTALEVRRQDLAVTFTIFDQLNPDDIDAAALGIEKHPGAFAIFSGEYRAAKRRAQSVLNRGTKYSKQPSFILALRALSSCLRDRAAFEGNADLRQVFGGLFAGTKTDWEALHACLNHADALMQRYGQAAATAALADWEGHVGRMKAAAVALERHTAGITAWLSRFRGRSNLATRPVTEIHAALCEAPKELGAAADFLCSGWCRTGISLQELVDTCDRYGLARRNEAAITEDRITTSIVGNHWHGASTRLDLLKLGVDWARAALNATQLTPSVMAWMIDPQSGLAHERLRRFRKIAAHFQSALDAHFVQLRRFGEIDAKRWVGTDDSLFHLMELTRSRYGQLNYLAPFGRWVATQKLISNAGLGQIIDFVKAAALDPDLCKDFYEYALYDRLVRDAINSDSSLRTFARASHESLRGKFAELDKEVLRLNAREIHHGLMSRTPTPGIGAGPVGQWTETWLVKNEIGKKRRHIPIRQLLKRAGNAIRTIKPCFLMSPLSVARFLDPELAPFDVVIMDEASQIRPEDALGAIARGQRMIVVGDPKQLPPTSFYERSIELESDDDTSAVQDAESILDVSLKQLPFRRLRWHYRSLHERLIQFSNDQFYDKDLIVAPSSGRIRRDAGVHSTFVQTPSYHKGRNRGEAEVVVANIIRHFERFPKLSLGVAAFNLVQAGEIEGLLDKARKDDPRVDERIRAAEAMPEPLFIKNLENVQGDERDVIFISTTYGPESPGLPVFQRFGPINSDLGWRRLNVIATRAKHRVEVFTSMRPSDIIVGGGARRGVVALRNYLEYASNQPLTEVASPTGGGPDSPFESSVLSIIQSLGFRTVSQVGAAGFFIDIGVLHPDHPGEYLLGIECDGAAYHSGKSVRDRDRLRQDILESKQWVIHRIWSTSWFHTRAAEIDRLRNALQKAAESFQARRHLPAIDSTFVIDEVPTITEVELQKEIATTSKSLHEALVVYRERNIGAGLLDRQDCILSERMIRILVAAAPESKEDWLQAVPLDLRLQLDKSQLQHLDGILEVIGEYAM